MKPLVFNPLAEAEVDEALAYYESQRPGLGAEFREDLQETLSRIRQSPGATTTIDDQGTRKVRFRRFPYTAYYVEFEDYLWIAAIAHQKRRPGYWSNRRP